MLIQNFPNGVYSLDINKSISEATVGMIIATMQNLASLKIKTDAQSQDRPLLYLWQCHACHVIITLACT